MRHLGTRGQVKKKVQEGNEFHNSAVLMKKISYNNPDYVHCATQFYAMTLNHVNI